MLKGFGSEDEYWDYEYMVYQKQLPIQKYVKSLENDYNNAHQDEFTEEQLAQNWNTKLDSIKKKLVKETAIQRCSETCRYRTKLSGVVCGSLKNSMWNSI